MQRFTSMTLLSLATPVTLLAIVAVSCQTREFNTGDSDVQGESFNPATPRGRKIAQYKAPSGQVESCVVPKHFPGVKYDGDDGEDEEKLCAMSFYKQPGSSDPGEAYAVCPKFASTFPGVELHDLDNKNKQSYETKECLQDSRPTSKEAKFKQSVSCAYTGSILGYYHVSRILGGAGNVPVGVARTMDIREHKKIADRGAANSSGINNQLWKQLQRMDSNPSFGSDNDGRNYFTPDLKQIFGALSKNPTHETQHSDLYRPSEGGSGAGISKSSFLNSFLVKRAKTKAAVGTMIKRDFASAVKGILPMKDVGDLMVLDYLFQQQDRWGNAHAVAYDYTATPEGGFKKKKVKDEGGSPADGAVRVKRILLKDNDCGNRVGDERSINLQDLKSLGHMSPRTYKGLRYLAAQWKEGKAQAFLKNEALMDTFDTFGRTSFGDKFGERLVAASDSLTAACKSGQLLLDLSLEDHIASKNLPELVKTQCDEILQPEEDTSINTNGNGGGNPNSGNTNPTNPSTPPAFVKKDCTVKSDDGIANVRKGPSISAEKYMTLNNGASVVAVAQEGPWFSVEYVLNQTQHGVRFNLPAFINENLLTCK